MKLKHVDLDQCLVEHDAREVRTKFSRSFPTYFFPVGDDIRAIVTEWITFLRTELLFGFDDPLFPATQVVVGDDGRFNRRAGSQVMVECRTDPHGVQGGV